MQYFDRLEGKLPFYKEEGFQSLDEGNFPFLEATIIFTAIVFIFEYYLDTRQYRNFITIKDVPTPLVGHVSEESFLKSQVYNTDKAEFAFAENLFSFWLSIITLIVGQQPWVWDKSKLLATNFNLITDNTSELKHEMIVTCVFIVIGTLLDSFVSMPFSYYRTFGIEERHGFNKTTLQTFIMDRIKMFFLMLVLTPFVVCPLIYVVRWGGDNFFIYASLLIFVIQMILMTVYPTYIAPLFNKYTKLESGETYESVRKLADEVKFPLTALYLVDGSTRSAHSNAYFYGFFKNKRIVLFDTLIEQVETPELLAILGHEIGHWKLGHTIQQLIISQVYMLVFFLAFSYLTSSKEMLQDFGFAANEPAPVFIGLSLFSSTFWAPVDKLLTLAMSSLSRFNEFAADAFARDLRPGMGDDLAQGLIKISKENLGNLVPDPFYASYHFSHPPVVDRLREVRQKPSKSGQLKKDD